MTRATKQQLQFARRRWVSNELPKPTRQKNAKLGFANDLYCLAHRNGKNTEDMRKPPNATTTSDGALAHGSLSNARFPKETHWARNFGMDRFIAIGGENVL
jgi:hypothetical protein